MQRLQFPAQKAKQGRDKRFYGKRKYKRRFSQKVRTLVLREMQKTLLDGRTLEKHVKVFKQAKILNYLLPLLSLDFGLKPLYPHFLQTLALIGFRALHFMHIFTFNSLASASGNLAMSYGKGKVI